MNSVIYSTPSFHLTEQPPNHRDAGLCRTVDIVEIPSYCIDDQNSHYIGKGTFGVVEKAMYRRRRDDSFEPAAIKYSSATHLPVLMREAKTMWNFRNHLNIVEIYGIYENPRTGRGVVMEYMECGSMADLIYDRKNIDYKLDHVASWMYQLSSAVNYFHSNNQVHRDLKLQNMLLSLNYITLKLCDFGTFTTVHQLMTSNRGSPMTMAPEIFLSKPYNTKADIFSIGIIMWQLIARDYPYKIDIPIYGLLYNVAKKNFRPRELECNPILSGFYKKCWHEDAKIRPTSTECLEYFVHLSNEYPKGHIPLWESSSSTPTSSKMSDLQQTTHSLEIQPDPVPVEIEIEIIEKDVPHATDKPHNFIRINSLIFQFIVYFSIAFTYYQLYLFLISIMKRLEF